MAAARCTRRQASAAVASANSAAKAIEPGAEVERRRPGSPLRRVDVVVREQPDEVLRVLGGEGQVDHHQREQRNSDYRRRGRGPVVAAREQIVEEAADDDRQAGQRRQDVVVELGDRQRHQRVGRDEPDRAEPVDPLPARLARARLRIGSPHHHRRQRRRRQRDPGEHRVAELAQEVFERAAIAVAPDHQPPPVVVAVELVPERLAVPDQHRVVPGDRHHRDRQQRQQDPESQLRAPQPLPVPGEAQVGQKDDHRQPEPRDPLGQRGEAAERRGDVEIERRLRAQAPDEREVGQEAGHVRQHHQHARERNEAMPEVEGPAQLDGVDDQLRQRDRREEAGGKVEQGVVGPAELELCRAAPRAGGAACPRRRTAPARPAPAPSSSGRRRPCRSSPGAPPGCKAARSRSPARRRARRGG